MLGSVALDVAIGLVTLYLLLSTVCSAAAELIMHRLRPRSGLLRDTIAGLFTDRTASTPPSAMPVLAGRVLGHGLVAVLPKGRSPSYIPAEAFAGALIDTLASPGGAGTGVPPTVEGLRATASKLPDSAARDALLATLDRAGDSLAEANRQIEAWYADAMDRVSGIYKRHTQLVLLALGLIFAAALNADTILIARALATDPAVREAVVAKALSTAQTPTPIPTPTPPVQPDPQAKMREAQDALLGSSLPLGWSSVPGDPRAFPWKPVPGRAPDDWTQSAPVRCLAKLAGLLMTAAAVSFGAPFWFDLLNRVTNLRAAGPKPKRPEERGVGEVARNG